MRYITCEDCRLKGKLNKVDGTPYCESCSNSGSYKPKEGKYEKHNSR